MTTKAKCINITDGVQCTKQVSWNYIHEVPKYCSDHLESRVIDGKIQRMCNVYSKLCTIESCVKELSSESETLCVFHYKLQLFKLKNLLNINNIKDLNKLKKQYESRLEQFNNLQIVADIDNFTNNHVTKYKLQGLKDIKYDEQLEEFKNCKVEEFVYLELIDINNIDNLKIQWNLEYNELTKNSKPTKEKVKKDKKDNNPKCIIENCKVSANYNKKGLKAIYCSPHAKNIGIGNKDYELRNVRTKLCEHIFEDGLDCIKVALYGIDKKQFCLSHIEEGMYKLSKDKECKDTW